MGKYASVVGGLIAIFLGLVGLINWFSLFVSVLKAVLPSVLILGGLIALAAGMSELKSTRKPKEEVAASEEEKK